MSGPATRGAHGAAGFAWARRAARRLWAEVRLVSLSIWRGSLGIYNSNDLTFASSIAYYALLSLFPFFLLAFSILGSVAGTESERAEILKFVLRYFPARFEFVNSQLDSMQAASVRLGVAGSVLMIWAAMGVFGAVTSAVNHAWGVEKQPSYFKHKLISLLMLTASGVLLLAGLLLVVTINVVEANWFAVVLDRVPGLATFQSFASKSASTVIFILVVGLVFYFVPNAKVRFKDVWVGAILTGLLWRLALTGFSWYVRDLTRFSDVHGSIAAVIVFLLWVYISAVIFLYGAEMTAAYARLRRHRPDEIPAAPTPRV